MAAVTVVQSRNFIDGNYREKFFTVNIATSGDTLATGMKNIKSAVFTNLTGAAQTITAMSASVAGVLTFTTSGAGANGHLVRVSGF